MGDKILTIVVPSYNMEKYLQRGLESLIISDNFIDKLEVLIVNDGSNDNTSNIGHSFQNKYPDIFKVIDKDNGHYGSCVNVGLKEARGTFIKILDADDYFLTDNFEKVVRCLISSEGNKENVDLFFCDWQIVDEDDKLKEKKSYSMPSNKLIEINKKDDIKFFEHIEHHAIIWRTSLLIKNNYIQTEKVAYSDIEWIYIPLLYVKRIMYYPLAVYSYLIGRSDQSMSVKSLMRGFNSMVMIDKSLLSIYLNSIGKYKAINHYIYTRLFVSHLKYLYTNYLWLYTNRNIIHLIKRFDDELKIKAFDIYNELQDTVVGKLNFKFIKEFRNRPYIYRIMHFFYKLKKCIKV